MMLDKLIKGLENLSAKLEKKQHDMLEDLGKYGVEFAKAHVVNIDTGETRDSIKYDVQGNKLVIEAGGNAVWLEFGTGITYNPDGYPGELPDGVSPIGTYGKGQGGTGEGWYFPTDTLKPRNQAGLEFAITDDGTRPLAYQAKDGTWMVHTYGIPSNHFMWDTINELEKKAAEMGLKIIDTEFKAI